MEVIARPKRWGNSIGIIIPRDVIKNEAISMNDVLVLTIEKKSDRERELLMKEGYLEMLEELKKVNKEWEKADYEE